MDYYLNNALDHLDPAKLSYSDWVRVGMALHNSGCDWSVWDEWSARDPTRYHPGECEHKWQGFGDCEAPVKAGTIIELAKQQGWTAAQAEEEDTGLEFNAVISDDFGPPVHSEAAQNKPEHALQPMKALQGLTPVEQASLYLRTLFLPGEYVGYVTSDVFQDEDGKWKPRRGVVNRKVDELLDSLARYPDDLGYTFGDTQPDAGAWIRFNPLDGTGAKNQNVTRYSYVLVESDTLPVEQQAQILLKLKVPVACLVSSGGKSLHAIVRVDAENAEQYKTRAEELYALLNEAGMQIDEQNKNSSRLSRLPGVKRGENEQTLLAVNLGTRSWEGWLLHRAMEEYDLPDPEPLSDTWDDPPPLPAPLIDGVLRCGHKMLLSGDSKAGKSFMLMELAISLAEGKPWLGFPCRKSKVFYMNLEIDRASAYHRFHEIYEALGWPPTHITDIDVWNLRGHSRALSELVPAVKRAMETSGADVLILDPIYKVITGDENSASEMGAFCNQFDRICSATGAAAIYCHHHSKGAQGQKKTMDRASGSGVFARDPDALLDLIGLEMDEDTRNNVRDGDATPWRLEGTLREFRNFEPRNLWFKYPLHVLDQENLSHLPVEGSFEAVRIKSHKYSTKNSRKAALENAFEALSLDSPVTVKAIAQYLKLDEHTVRGHLHQFPESFEFWKGEVRRPEGYCEDSEEDEEDELSAS